jgi:3-oxoadipate enol-lactonase
MWPILVRVVNEDLRPELPALRVPTLLVWGEHDTAAPPEIAHEMESLIPGSGLVLLPQSAHFPYLDEPRAFSAVLRSFLSSICSGAAS